MNKMQAVKLLGGIVPRFASTRQPPWMAPVPGRFHVDGFADNEVDLLWARNAVFFTLPISESHGIRYGR
jgi:hypothetical protein